MGVVKQTWFIFRWDYKFGCLENGADIIYLDFYQVYNTFLHNMLIKFSTIQNQPIAQTQNWLTDRIP